MISVEVLYIKSPVLILLKPGEFSEINGLVDFPNDNIKVEIAKISMSTHSNVTALELKM